HGPTDEALEPGPFLGGHAVAQGLAVEERLDGRLGDERRLRLALGEAASVGLGLEVDGEGRPQDDHGDEADRGMDAEEPDHRTPGSAPIPHTADYRRRGHRTGPGNALLRARLEGNSGTTSEVLSVRHGPTGPFALPLRPGTEGSS